MVKPAGSTARQVPAIEPKPAVLTLGVRDFATTRKFYLVELGWRPTFEVPDEGLFIQVAGGMLLAFRGVENLSAEADGAGFGDRTSPIALAHNVDSPGLRFSQIDPRGASQRDSNFRSVCSRIRS